MESLGRTRFGPCASSMSHAGKSGGSSALVMLVVSLEKQRHSLADSYQARSKNLLKVSETSTTGFEIDPRLRRGGRL